MEDGIEIHFDEKRGYLQLACEPDAFAPYREMAKKQLEDFPEIPIEKILEINIIDTATLVARRDAPKRGVIELVIGIFFVLIITLAGIGAWEVIKKIAN